jgi:hypothetical protein
MTVREKLARYCKGNFDPLGYCLRVGKKVQADVIKEIARPAETQRLCAAVNDDGSRAMQRSLSGHIVKVLTSSVIAS